MFIVNGRMGKDAQVGRPTCKNVSVVDYFICTPRLFSTIVNWNILILCSLMYIMLYASL